MSQTNELRKECSRCRMPQSVANFHKRARSKDGLQPWCKPCLTGYNSGWLSGNPTRVAVYQSSWRLNNSTKIKSSKRSWCKKNPDKIRVSEANRQAVKLKATLAWLTADHYLQIAHVYASCPPGHHVDHIVPLRGDSVCGLHVPWNLQHLPAVENLKKGNKLIG